MNYPLISEYIEAIKAPEDNFDKLTHLTPVLDNNGQPIISSGNFAVVFKMEDTSNGKLYAVKCFIKEQEDRAESYQLISDELNFLQSSFLVTIKYLNKELFVDSNNASEEELPIVLMDWVEGETLDKYIRKIIHDKYQLSLLAYQFSRLSMWLLTQSFAHGDLKPDNIIVRNDGTLTLVDYDGMYVPAMRGQKARELGSPDFRHPSRTENVFDEHIDDFSIASIMLSLKAIAVEPELLDKYGAEDRLLFAEKDYREILSSKIISEISIIEDLELRKLVSIFNLAALESNLTNISFRLFGLKLPQKHFLQKKRLMTRITNNDGIAWQDEYGGVYSVDKKSFLRMTNGHKSNYSILEGVIFIEGYAFFSFSSLTEIIIPNSVTNIGRSAFHGCKSLIKIIIPDSVTSIGSYAFWGCSSLMKIIIPDSVTSIGENAFRSCSSLKEITIPNSVISIGSYAFYGCRSLIKIIIPDSVTSIGENAFYGCRSLIKIIIPDSVTSIGENAFSGCSTLTEITIPDSVTSIGSYAFLGCSSLMKIIIPDSVTSIGENTFFFCFDLKQIIIPKNADKVLQILSKYENGEFRNIIVRQ